MSNILTKKSDHIEIDGHIGTWYVVDTTIYNGTNLFLLEHEDYGDMAAALIVDKNKKIILDDVWNGFGDLDML